MNRKYIIYSAIVMLFAAKAFAQVADDETPAFTAEERMKEMTRLVDSVTMKVSVDNEDHEAKRTPKALLRTLEEFRKGSEKEDGSLWLWSYDGLPVAVVELFAHDNRHTWGHTLLAVSDKKILGKAGTREWRPRLGSGVVFAAVPKSMKPHANAALRKAQMRKISRRFATNIEDPGQNNYQQFRLLTEPVHRYKGGDVEDGAVFAFVRGQSNPEVLLFIQSRAEKWEYGLLRCSSNELVAKLDDVEVWRAEQVPGWIGGANGPFWVVYRRSQTAAGL